MEMTLDSILNVILQTADKLMVLIDTIPRLYFWYGLGALETILVILFVSLVIRRRRKSRIMPPEKKDTTSEVIDAVAEEEISQTPPAPASDKNKISEPEEPGPALEPEPKPEPVAEPEPIAEPEPELKAEPVSFFARLKAGLTKTRSSFTGGLDRIFTGSRSVDDDLLEEIEELLITSDMGVQTTMNIVQNIAQKHADISTADGLKSALKQEILALMDTGKDAVEHHISARPHIIMVVGVNGVGKTTTIGKLAARLADQGKKVLVVAGDTFRAAAIEQLTIWAEKSGADIVKQRDGSDPAAVAYDGVEAAVARNADVVLIDTAGRLHTKVNLMEQLKKVKRAIGKSLPEAPHEILVVLDATTGQNAMSQVKQFHEALDVTGIALTKLDGTAKGGIVISICSTMNIPLMYIGVGEKIDDLQDFDPKQFVDALL